MSGRRRFDDAWQPDDEHMAGAGSSHGSVSSVEGSDVNVEDTRLIAGPIEHPSQELVEFGPSDWRDGRATAIAERPARVNVPFQVQHWEAMNVDRPPHPRASGSGAENVTREEADAAMMAVAEGHDELAEGLDLVAADVQGLAEQQELSQQTAEQAREAAATADERAQAALAKARETLRSVDDRFSQTEERDRKIHAAVQKMTAHAEATRASHTTLAARTGSEFSQVHGSIKHLDQVQEDQAAQIEALQKQLREALTTVQEQRSVVTNLKGSMAREQSMQLHLKDKVEDMQETTAGVELLRAMMLSKDDENAKLRAEMEALKKSQADILRAQQIILDAQRQPEPTPHVRQQLIDIPKHNELNEPITGDCGTTAGCTPPPGNAEIPELPQAPSSTFTGNVPPVPPVPPVYNAPPLPPPPVASTSTGLFNMTITPSKPLAFKGKLEEDVDTWINTVRDYLELFDTTEPKKVAFTVTLFQEYARDWWDAFMLENAGVRPGTLNELLFHLRQRFASPLQEKMTRKEIRQLKQGSQSVRAMSAKFSALLCKLPTYDDGWALDLYQNALNPRIAQLVAMQRPRDLSDAIDIAENVDMAQTTTPSWDKKAGQNFGQKKWRPNFYRNSGQNFRNSSQNFRGNNGQNRGGRFSRGGANQSRGSGSRGRFAASSSGRNQTQNQTHCYICDQPGHWANTCPQRGRSNQNRGSRRRPTNAVMSHPRSSSGSAQSQQTGHPDPTVSRNLQGN